jgi:hypothetical protein
MEKFDYRFVVTTELLIIMDIVHKYTLSLR